MPSIKGTASVSDDHAMTKMLKSTKFPANFSSSIQLSKINVPVLSQWVEQRIAAILGFDDEIVQSTAINLFMPTVLPDAPPPVVNPRRAQLDLAGFLGEEEAAGFAEELWTLLLDAQSSPMGIPRKLLEAKKREMNESKASGAPPSARRAPEMNRFVVEARQRAEAARQALGASGPPADEAVEARPVPPVARPQNVAPAPVPVSPPHPSEHPVERKESVKPEDDRKPRHEEERKPSRRRTNERDDDDYKRRYYRDEGGSSRRRRRSPSSTESDSSEENASDLSSRDSRDRQDDRRRRYRREEERRGHRGSSRRYRYDSEEEEDRRHRRRDDRRRRSRDRDQHERRSRDDRDRDRRRRRDRSEERDRYGRRRRSRSYDRDGSKRRRRHRSRSSSGRRSDRSRSRS